MIFGANGNEAALRHLLGRFSESIDLLKSSFERSAPGDIIVIAIDHFRYFIHKKNGIEEGSFPYLVTISF